MLIWCNEIIVFWPDIFYLRSMVAVEKEQEVVKKLTVIKGENKYEYSLQEIISEEPAEGNFYVEGQSISGSGLGYGQEGVIEFSSCDGQTIFSGIFIPI